MNFNSFDCQQKGQLFPTQIGPLRNMMSNPPNLQQQLYNQLYKSTHVSHDVTQHEPTCIGDVTNAPVIDQAQNGG